jgi:hypothetical protein
MCFLIENKIKVADREITCYKAVERKTPEMVLSGLRKYPYLRDVMQPMISFSLRRIRDTRVVDFGYHSWSTGKYGANAEFLIPVGSKYYYNEKFEEYVSDCIKFKRMI